MEFMDENTLYAEYLEILRKLYIVRDSHNIASDFSCLETIRQCFKTSNLAALNQREQQLLLRLFPAVQRIAVVMSGQASDEVLRYCTANMDAYERSFCLLLSDIYDSRGTLNARLHNFELSPEYVNKENSRFVKRVLGFVLRYFGYSSAVELIPASFDIQSFEMMLMGKYNEILEINKSYAAVVSVWIQNLDTINVILARLMVHGELPSGLIDSLSYECIEFLTFLENAVHRKIEKREPDLQTRKARFSAAYNEIFYILAIKGIWEDAQNPPYSYTPEMLLDDVFSEDDDRLDRRAQNFLRARALQFERYRNIFRLRDPRSFVRAYNSLQPEDQAFVSVYASLLAFYENHGRNSFKEDSWYVPYFYKRLSPSACAFAVQEEPSRPDTEYTKDESGAYEPETPDTSEESLVSGADYPEKQEVSENTSDEGRSESTRSENDSDRALLFDTREIFSKEQLSNFFVDRYFSLSDETLNAYQTSIDIFYKLGIAYKNNPPSDSFDYQAVWRHLLQAGDSTLSQEEKAFVDDRYAGMALYSSTMNMPASTALKVMASLKEDDLGFLLALLVLKSVKPKKDERSDKNGQQAIKTAEDESRDSNGDDVSSRVEVKVKSSEDASRDAHTDSSADREINR
ncbi:MAG: hypothetical protein J5934_06605, partial [Succinivibrio sp.]|nr:hypothetical protein [Succinivibrio sp.]